VSRSRGWNRRAANAANVVNAVETAAEHRTGFVALGGRTNVGKSTLLNRLVGRKVAIVTPRPQTTRARILGIRNDPDAQMILIDTPGIHEPRRPLNQRMVDTARRSLAEGEVVLAVIEAGARLHPADRDFLKDASKLTAPAIIVINKIDRLAREQLLPLIDECRHELPGAEIVPVSARTGENLDDLVATIKRYLRVGPALMPADEYTDQSERTLAAEIIREKIFLKMREEVPFTTAVRIERFEEDAARKLIRISAVVVVERDSHKGMIIGAGGQMLKEIGTAARLDLERLLDARVFLELFVRVEPNWTKDPRKLGELGM
jgi:GTP-binding protein Era